MIVRPRDVADIQRAVVFAREHALPLSIKGGGHNVAGHAVTDGGLMLDLAAMRAVRIDPAARLARVQGGALWSDVDRESTACGLATTGGAISHTGVAGLTLGGGIGWLVGKHGMTIDNLLSVDLVTADGEFVTASAESHPDLFWALRGGGGNFGVATSFEFALHPQGEVLAGVVAYPVAQARQVLDFYREFTAKAPDQLTVYAQIATDPEFGRPARGDGRLLAGRSGGGGPCPGTAARLRHTADRHDPPAALPRLATDVRPRVPARTTLLLEGQPASRSAGRGSRPRLSNTRPSRPCRG